MDLWRPDYQVVLEIKVIKGCWDSSMFLIRFSNSYFHHIVASSSLNIYYKKNGRVTLSPSPGLLSGALFYGKVLRFIASDKKFIWEPAGACVIFHRTLCSSILSYELHIEVG